jgi:hypothetical protein
MRWGEGMAMCLKQNKNQLTPACQTEVAELAKRHEKFAKVRKTCELDRSRFCKEVRPGSGRVLSCLKANQAKASNTCQRDLQSLDSNHQG